MSPGAALAQFEPPEGLNLSIASETVKETRARYGFRVGDLGLLIGIEVGSEVLSMPPIATLPGSPRGFLGLINLRGNLVPLYELGDLLGSGFRRVGSANAVLVFGQGEQAVGVTIDGFPIALAALRPLSGLPQLPEAIQKHVPAGFVQDQSVWLEFDHGAFFDEICCDLR